MEHKHIMGLLKSGFMMGLLLACSTSWAESWVDRTRLDGFFSARYSITNEKALWQGGLNESGINEDGSFYGTKLGLDITSRVSDRLTVATQLFAPIQENGYDLHVDWAFATFNLTEQLDLRAGKIKYPVGIVNEYVEVGVTYPWIQAPVVIYSESMASAQATRESYTGASLLWTRNVDDWSWSVDFFGGQVDLENMTIKEMVGVTGRANWDDTVIFQLSAYQGDMKTDLNNMMMAPMNNARHASVVGGVKIDWNDWIVYAEGAQVQMDFKDMMGVSAGDSDSWYATVGHRFGKWLPHLTYQDWDRDNGNGHQISTLGLNYNISSKLVVKGEVSKIDTDGDGLFESTPSDDSTRMFSVAVDMVF